MILFKLGINAILNKYIFILIFLSIVILIKLTYILFNQYHLNVITTSSILRIILTTYVAKVKALLVTKDGCKTFSSFILITFPFLTLIPENCSPLECFFLNYVTTLIGFIPAFSASVNGIISRAYEYALKIIASIPFKDVICSLSL